MPQCVSSRLPRVTSCCSELPLGLQGSRASDFGALVYSVYLANKEIKPKDAHCRICASPNRRTSPQRPVQCVSLSSGSGSPLQVIGLSCVTPSNAASSGLCSSMNYSLKHSPYCSKQPSSYNPNLWGVSGPTTTCRATVNLTCPRCTLLKIPTRLWRISSYEVLELIITSFGKTHSVPPSTDVMHIRIRPKLIRLI